MKKILYTAGTAAFMLALGSCTKEPLNELSQEESRIYITNHDSTADFSTYQTFSISDSVAVISNNRLEEKVRTNVDAAYIEAVKAEMQQRGYVLVNKDQNPDLGINVNRVYNSYTGVFSYGNYWDNYYGYWDPYYWGYPGYGYYTPVYYGTYQVEEGAMAIDMLDLKNAASNGNQLEGIWSGLIRGTGVFNEATASSQVKQLFDQSAYISAGQ